MRKPKAKKRFQYRRNSTYSLRGVGGRAFQAPAFAEIAPAYAARVEPDPEPQSEALPLGAARAQVHQTYIIGLSAETVRSRSRRPEHDLPD